MLTRFYVALSRKTRQMSVHRRVNLNVKMDEDTYRLIDNEELKPRKHPGKIFSKTVQLPPWLLKAVDLVLEDTPKPALLADGEKMANFLNGRHPPVENSDARSKLIEIQEKIAMQRNMMNVNESDESIAAKDEKIIMRRLKQTLHAWSPVRYNRYAGFLYLVSRSPQEYAVLHRIFHEISIRDQDFRPKTLLDFGSGVGSVLWATSHLWPGSIQEHICVDSSTEMNDLSESIISHADPKIDRVFYRQYVPLSHRKYDIVVSAYSLLEMPNMQTRLQNVSKLWDKTARYLVIVEQGTNAGFKVVNEARDFILHLERTQDENKPRNFSIFSPCPHELKCPRYKTDNTPCNFEIAFDPLRIRNPVRNGTERYSYIVFKKGDGTTSSWPRLVRPTLLRSKHTICRMCTADGKLNEIVFTASKHGRWMYRCAKSSKWGDRLPIETAVESSVEMNEEAEKSETEEEEEDPEK